MTGEDWVPGVILAFVIWVAFMIGLCLLFLHWSLKRIDKIIDAQIQELDVMPPKPDGPFRNFKLTKDDDEQP